MRRMRTRAGWPIALASFASSSSAAVSSRPGRMGCGSGSAGGQQRESAFALRLIAIRRLTISHLSLAVKSTAEGGRCARPRGTPCFKHLLEFRDGGHPPRNHDLAVDHHGRCSQDAEIQNVGNARYVPDVGCEIEFSAGVDGIPFRILAIGASARRSATTAAGPSTTTISGTSWDRTRAARLRASWPKP